MSQERLNKAYDYDYSEEDYQEPVGQDRRDALTAEADDILDEIDEVLEENAEEFVGAYVQRDGQ